MKNLQRNLKKCLKRAVYIATPPNTFQLGDYCDYKKDSFHILGNISGFYKDSNTREENSNLIFTSYGCDVSFCPKVSCLEQKLKVKYRSIDSCSILIDDVQYKEISNKEDIKKSIIEKMREDKDNSFFNYPIVTAIFFSKKVYINRATSKNADAKIKLQIPFFLESEMIPNIGLFSDIETLLKDQKVYINGKASITSNNTTNTYHDNEEYTPTLICFSKLNKKLFSDKVNIAQFDKSFGHKSPYIKENGQLNSDEVYFDDFDDFNALNE